MANDEVDFIFLFKKIINEWLTILKFSLIIIFLSIFYLMLRNDVYESSSKILPQYNSFGNSNDISDLASLAGVQLNSNNENNTSISPILYPQIFNSISFKKEILDEKIIYLENDVKKELSIREYYLSYYKKGLIDDLFSYLSTFLNFNSENKDESSYDLDVIKLSDNEISNLEKLSNDINIQVNKKEGYFIISTISNIPEISSQITSIATRLLQHKIIGLRINRDKEKLLFLEKRLSEKKNDFFDVQKKLSEFKDKNISITTSQFEIELKTLEYEFQTQNNIYTNLSSQYENQILKVKENTPIFTVLEPVFVPYTNSNISKFSFLFLSTIFSIIASISYIFINDLIKKLFK